MFDVEDIFIVHGEKNEYGEHGAECKNQGLCNQNQEFRHKRVDIDGRRLVGPWQTRFQLMIKLIEMPKEKLPVIAPPSTAQHARVAFDKLNWNLLKSLSVIVRVPKQAQRVPQRNYKKIATIAKWI